MGNEDLHSATPASDDLSCPPPLDLPEALPLSQEQADALAVHGAIRSEAPRPIVLQPGLPPEEPGAETGGVSTAQTIHLPLMPRWFVPTLSALSLVLLFAYVVPYLVYHWRVIDARGDAEAVFTKRRAELKAEAEHADERLALLDKRVHLTGLGFREVVRKVKPHVVDIANYREPHGVEMGLLRNKPLVHDPDTNQPFIQAGSGSGVIIKPGVVLTNHHVVEGASRLRVTFPSGDSVGVDMNEVSVDALTDLAIVRLPAHLAGGLAQEANVSTDFADSSRDVQVGDWALAIGSPFDLRQTVTQGVVSAKGRLLKKRDMVELLQTDAAINPGNSGGPLFDQYGRIIGINVAIVEDEEQRRGIGIGFAIPSNTARKVAEQLLEHGEVQRGYLGVALAELPAGDPLREGAAVVKEVVPGQAGDQAGLHVGDIVIRFNGNGLNRAQPVRHLRQLIVDVDPGAAITLQIRRGQARQEISVKVGKRPPLLP